MIQYLIVSLIVLAAFGYAGLLIYRRAKSFSAKKSCGTNCGCETKSDNIQFN